MQKLGSYDTLELAYQKFKRENSECQSKAYVEYIGVNFSEDSFVSPVFKTYYTTTKSFKNISSLLKPLIERDMVRALNRVDDNINKQCVRYEIGLKNRTNQNIEFVLRYLCSMMPEIKSRSNEIKAFSNIKCTDLKYYNYAALYFIGFIADVRNPSLPVTKVVKLHYLLRNCANPDEIGRNYIIDNDLCLKLLSSLEISKIQKVAIFIEQLLKINHAELWMAAVDYYKDGNSKYKIYLKNIQIQLYDDMIKQLIDMGHTNLANQIRMYLQWSNIHPELEKYGMAICLDNKDIWSVNFYH